MRGVLTAVFLIIGSWPVMASAFERCDGAYTSPAQLRQMLVEHGVHGAPVAHFENARAILIDTDASPAGLIPHAGWDSDGGAVIFYPAAFMPMLCRFALATFLVNGDADWRPFAVAARDAGQCIDATADRDRCLLSFGRDLEQGYRADFAALEDRAQSLAYQIFTEAGAQIAAHEYAHHLLDHRRRIEAEGLARIDAEFEADFYALQNAAQNGTVVSAMFYFFKGLADVESYSKSLDTPDYESGACRAINVDDIARLFGITPLVMLDAVDGGGVRLRLATPDLLANVAAELAQSPPPQPDPEGCGRLQGTVLREAHDELRRLVTLLAEYDGILYSPAGGDPADRLALDSPEAIELIDRLQAETGDFRHLNALTAQIASRLAQRMGYGGANARIDAQLDRMLTNVAPAMISRDYGRLLKVKGLNILYESSGIPPRTRAAEATRLFRTAITYAPEQTEAWVNLAMLEVAASRCDQAAADLEAARSTAIESKRAELDDTLEIVRDGIAASRCDELAAIMRGSLGLDAP